MQNKKYSLKETLILESSLKLMFSHNYEFATVDSVASACMLRDENIKVYFSTDDELRMAAMEYAAVKWVNYIIELLDKEKNPIEKFKLLIRHYASGSKDHPDSLSLYIDLWKYIREIKGNNQFVKQKLAQIYKYYADVFVEVLPSEIKARYTSSQVAQLAWILVTISDGLHIQSIIDSAHLDFDRISELLYQFSGSLTIEKI